MDGRTDLYNDEIVNKWLKVVRVEDGWQDILNEYEVNLILIKSQSMLDHTLALSPDWVAIYRDTISVLYEQK